jgi:eukaryotic-like serine/threonine-protein kinase
MNASRMTPSEPSFSVPSRGSGSGAGSAGGSVGRYVIGESFASGGMGAIHLGRIRGAGGFARTVAVKRLFPGFANDAGFRAMLLDEARLVSRIRHPNVVPTLDVWEEENDLYVVMEYVHGVSLSHLIRRPDAGPVPVGIALGILECVLSGLHAAHEARSEDGTPLGMVHRDVSPQNILVGADGVVRLIDFGIAKAATGLQVTDPGVIKGKTGYMAPEQLVGQRVSRQADIFAASAVLWEALTNRVLLDEHGEEALSRRVTTSEDIPPSRYRDGVTAALDAIVLRGLAFRPGDRFPTAEAMAVAIRKQEVPAPAVEIAQWVQAAASDELELSEERVRLFEQAPPDASSSVRSLPRAAPSTPDVTAVTTKPESPGVANGEPAENSDASHLFEGWGARWSARWSKWGRIGGAVAVGAAAVAIFQWGSEQRHRSLGAMPATLSTPDPAASPQTGSASASSSIAPGQMPAAADEGSAAHPVAASAVASSAPFHARSSQPPVPALGAKALPAARGRKASCDPPYTLDASGRKTYDPRCF